MLTSHAVPLNKVVINTHLIELLSKDSDQRDSQPVFGQSEY